MPRTRLIYNPSKCISEKAKLVTCPRCRGFGGVAFKDDDGCTMCNSHGEVWMSSNSAVLHKYGRFGVDERLY